MGLAAAKNKRKLGSDPNNTKWSRNTDSFGQKILRAQGWQPGEYLGAKDAPHAEWHTEANTTHIRVILKDDTMGLGAKRNNGDECTGLDAFQSLLGRLNGKSDETLETERKAREEVKLSLYVARKFGPMRFVRGGWLVGDQLKEIPDADDEKAQIGFAPDSQKGSANTSEGSEPATVKPKKRKADRESDAEDNKAHKKEKKSKKRKTDSENELDDRDERKRKKEKRKKHGESESAETKPVTPPESSDSAVEVDSTSEAKKEKKEKKEKRDKKDKKKDKRDKKEKKEKRKKEKEASESGAETSDNISKAKKRKEKDAPKAISDSSLPTPGGSGSSTPVPTGSNRYMARSRFIAQKKMAFADSAALNQIFMIKS